MPSKVLVFFDFLCCAFFAFFDIYNKPQQQQKKWLKSNEVRELLNISPGTLQNLRINGTLTYTRVGGVLFYESAHIDKLLNENKIDNRDS